MGAKKVAFHTLGCKVNQYDSYAMAGIFEQNGYELVNFENFADVYIINTCTVTHTSERKSRQMIRRAIRINPAAVIAVVGCYAQVAPAEVASIPGVKLVVGTQDKSRIVELVQACFYNKDTKPLVNVVRPFESCAVFEEMPAVSHQSRTRAFIKVQEGCDSYCSYCVIPYARGPLRSRDPASISEEVNKLVRMGYLEIVLTGIHIGAYGRDFGTKINLAVLIKQLLAIPGLARLRLSSIEPQDFTPELLEIMAQSSVFCRHLHLPLQSGDDHILHLMRRQYDTAAYAKIVQDVRKKIGGIGITTDVIVGFPGEKEGHFENTYKLIKELKFSGLHVFKYSPRKLTAAAAFPDQVPAIVKEERSRALINLSGELFTNFASGFIGNKMGVVAEQHFKGQTDMFEGLTDNYLKVVFPSNEDLHGKLVDVRIDCIGSGITFGTII